MGLVSLIDLHFEDVSVEDCVASFSRTYGATSDKIAHALGVSVSDLNAPDMRTRYCTISAHFHGESPPHSCRYQSLGHVFPGGSGNKEIFMYQCSYLSDGVGQCIEPDHSQST